MGKSDNKYVVDKVVELTASMLADTVVLPNKDGGESIANFMQTIYDKLSELYTNYD